MLCCLALLVNVLGEHSAATYPLLLPLLRDALHPNSMQPELLEDGLGLWLVAVRNAPSLEAGAPLLELTPALTACLTNSTGMLLRGMGMLFRTHMSVDHTVDLRHVACARCFLQHKTNSKPCDQLCDGGC